MDGGIFPSGGSGGTGGVAGAESGGGAGTSSGGAACFDVAPSSSRAGTSNALDYGTKPVLPDVTFQTLALTQSLRQPYPGVSYICQSYRGYSHSTGYSFDIGMTPQSCSAGNNDSGGKDVVAPASGTVTHLPTTGLGAYVCLQVAGAAVVLGHVKAASGISVGSVVTKGQKVATVALASDTASGNGGIAHLHFEVFAGTGCYNGNPQPFTGEYRIGLRAGSPVQCHLRLLQRNEAHSVPDDAQKEGGGRDAVFVGSDRRLDLCVDQ